MKTIDRIKTRPEAALAATAIAAASSFGLLANNVVSAERTWRDLRLRSRIPTYSRKQKKTMLYFGHLGKEWSVLPLAAGLGAKLWRDDKKQGAVAVSASALLAIAASHLFDVTLPQRTPPPGRKAPFDPHFPSGHALHSGTVLLTGAYVLTREEIASPKVAIACATALGAALGVDRLLQDRHWSSDIAGGWLAAAAIASLIAAGYEVSTRDARRKHPRVNGRGKRKSADRVS